MISWFLIVYFFGIGNVFLHVTSDEPSGSKSTSYEFEVELLGRLGEALYPNDVLKKGPKISQDMKIRNELCIAAKNYFSLEFEDSVENPGSLSSKWAYAYYLDLPDSFVPNHPTFFYYIFCKTKPELIHLRGTDSPNKFVIALTNIHRTQANGVYHYIGLLSDAKEYSFNITIVQVDPVHNASAGELEKDISLMENDDLRAVYRETKFVEWIYICLKAKDHIHQQYPQIVKPVTRCSPAGLRRLKVYNQETGKLDDQVGFRCPIVPPLYLYFAKSTPVTTHILLVLET